MLFLADAWGVDAAYSGSQKCLSAPPGAAPLMLGPRAVAKLRGRKTKASGGGAAASRRGGMLPCKEPGTLPDMNAEPQ